MLKRGTPRVSTRKVRTHMYMRPQVCAHTPIQTHVATVRAENNTCVAASNVSLHKSRIAETYVTQAAALRGPLARLRHAEPTDCNVSLHAGAFGVPWPSCGALSQLAAD